MLNFKPLSIADKAWIDEIVFLENSPNADFNFGNLYCWNELYKRLVCRCGDRLLMAIVFNGRPTFIFPIGSGSLRPAIEAMRSFATENAHPMSIRSLTEKNVSELETEYPNSFTFTECVTCGDYIYSATRLSTYSGKALHGKKNHCNRFEAEHDWDFLPLEREHIGECIELLDAWLEENATRLKTSIRHERTAILRAFSEYEALGLEGGVLRSNGKIIGFTAGEMTNADTFDVHFEKSSASINGAYPMLCREFVRLLISRHAELKYINREEDMGIEALRKSKLSYKPEYILKKYTARMIDE